MHPNKYQGKSSEPIISSSVSIVNIVNQNIEMRKVRNNESDNLNQTIETLNACDNLPMRIL